MNRFEFTLNYGSEICSKLRKLGIDCLYLRNGLKRWTELGFPLTLNSTKENFGSIPVFENVEKFLTPNETKEYLKSDVILVDARRKEEFEKNHIEKSINIPFMDLSDLDLDYQINSLPLAKNGIIVTCFGYVSCSEASSFGWELNRRGIKYLGAYGSGELQLKNKDYLYNIYLKESKNWIKGLTKLDKEIIYIFSLFTLTILWFFIKNTTKEYIDIKNRKNSIKKSLIPTIISIFYYILIYLTSDILTFNINHMVLIFLSSIMLAYHINKMFLINNKLINIIVFIFILFILNEMNKNILFVMFISSTLSILMDISIKNLNSFILNNKKNKILINLKNFNKLFNHKSKAGKLSFFLSKNFNVPIGYVIMGKNIKNLNNQSLSKIEKLLGNKIAIRSTANNEDGEYESQAGLNLSIIPVDLKNIKINLKKVLNSYKSSDEKNEFILIQKIINPIVSGVIFSKNPLTSGALLIEYIDGFSGQLMSGEKNGNYMSINRISHEIIESSNKLIDTKYKELILLLLNVEKEIKAPVDIEWAIDKDGIIWLLQVRHQTGIKYLYPNLIDYDKDKLIENNIYKLQKSEISFMMKNASPMSVSLFLNIWEKDSIAYQASKMAYWKWHKKINNLYCYSFKNLWVRKDVYIKQPNKFISWLSKILYKQNIKYIRKEQEKILDNFEILSNVNFKNLSNEKLIIIFNQVLSNWKILQKDAIYVELVAQNTITSINNLKDLTSNSEISYNKLAYYADKEYLLEIPRNIEQNNKNLINKEFIINNKNLLNGNSDKKIIFANNMILDREIFKYNSLKYFYLLRLILLAIKEKLNLENEFWNLKIEEIDNIFKKNNIKQKLEKREQLLTIINLPDEIDLTVNFDLSVNTNASVNKNMLFVSNPKDIEGEILLLNNDDVNIIKNKIIKERKRILYSEYITPEIVILAKEMDVELLCAKYGSVLSHPSVLARENNISFIINMDIKDYNYIKIKNGIISLNKKPS